MTDAYKLATSFNYHDCRADYTARLIAFVLSLYLAIGPAYAFSLEGTPTLTFSKLSNIAVSAGKFVADYSYSAAAGSMLYVSKNQTVTNMALGQQWRKRFAAAGRGGAVGIAVNVAVEAALKGVGWILDPANNRIYKKQISENDGSLEFSPASSFGNPNISCTGPYSVVQQLADCLQNKIRSFKEEYSKYSVEIVYPADYQTKIKDLKPGQTTTIYDVFVYRRESGDVYNKTHLQVKKVGETTETEVEATDQDVADAVERAEQSTPGTKQDLATPTKQEDEEGSHAPNEAAKSGAQPPPPDTKTCREQGQVYDSATNKCKPLETNDNPATDLPAFCVWAKPVCDLVEWFKKEPEKPTDTKLEKKSRDVSDVPELQGFDINQKRFEFGGQCPSPVTFATPIMGTDFSMQWEWTGTCQLLQKLRPAIIAAGVISAAAIAAGFGLRGNDD